jgi:hypothetical protein
MGHAGLGEVEMDIQAMPFTPPFSLLLWLGYQPVT